MEYLSLKCIPIILLSLFLSNCSHQRIQKVIPDETIVSAIEFSSILSTTDDNGNSLNIIDDKEIIYFYNSMIMYQIPVYSTVSQGMAKDETIKPGSDSSLPSSYTYIVFNEKEDSIGLSYTSVAGPILDTVSKKNFVANGFRNFGRKFLQTHKSDKLFKSQKNNDSLLEVYIPRVKLNDSFSDTTYLYYRKDFNDVKFSLVSELDSLKKMKLFRILSIFKGNPESTDPTYRQSRQLTLEIDKKVVKNQEFISSLFKRSKKDFLAH